MADRFRDRAALADRIFSTIKSIAAGFSQQLFTTPFKERLMLFRKNGRRRMTRLFSTSIEAAEIRQLLSASPLSAASSIPKAAPASPALNLNEVPATASPIGGTGNNISHPDWGSAGIDLLRTATAAYGDGVSTPAGADRPSPREISNVLSDQAGQDILSDRNLSAMIYAWGQFVDHDIDLTPTSGTESLSIAVPAGDPSFDPLGTGTQTIDTTRSIFDPATGTDAGNPRQQINAITAFLDGSVIYGSNDTTAATLRTFEGGHLATSDGDLLPRNNSNDLSGVPLDMANDAHIVSSDQLFAAGDVRANENIELTSLQTLFLREHNYWADRISAQNPSLSDEEIYQQARAIVVGEMQSITYNEWLPALLGPQAMPQYAGYDPSVNPSIANEFSTAAYRFGHSLLGDDVEFLDNNGLEVADQIPLSQAFFNPDKVAETGIDPILKYLTADPASEVDVKVVGSVRNFLFGPPGSGGLDLASLNIERGRDHGLADYNTVREAYGLPRVTDFSEITSNPELQAKLQQLYGSVDNIDLWVGGLAEDHVAGSSVGATVQAILVDQFSRIRAGDRFWFENQFSGRMLQQLEHTSLSDIIKRNSTTTNIQHNVFFFQAEISGSLVSDLNTNHRADAGDPGLAGQTVQLINTADGEVVGTATTDRYGHYQFGVLDGLRTGTYQVQYLLQDGNVIHSEIIAVTRGDQFFRNIDLAVAPPKKDPPKVQPPKARPPKPQPPQDEPSRRGQPSQAKPQDDRSDSQTRDHHNLQTTRSRRR
jgi:hypothetical protein